jgi:hypothetical protein
MLEGAAILLAGMVLGHWLSRRILGLRLRGLGKLPPKPVCSCGDPPSLHDPKTKHCQAERLVQYNSIGNKELRRCPCRRYDGPEPLPEFYAPELNP